MRAKENKETTISLLFRTLRSVYNKAIEQKCANKVDYPFNDYKVSKFDLSTQKRAIPKSDILKIMRLNLSDKPQYTRFSRDIFIFSYLCAGINFTDIANLQPSNIADNRLQYTRQKTSKKINISLSDKAIEIITQYANNTGNKNYIFPILDNKKHISATQKQNRIHKVLGHINKHLKTIAESANVENISLTTYVARHSFATTLKKSGVHVELISEALGHSDISTTQIYLGSFDNIQIDEAMKYLL